MNLLKRAYKYKKLEEDIKRLKLKGYSNEQIADKLGLTENRVRDILSASLASSKLVSNEHNKKQASLGLPGFDPANIKADFSRLSKLGEAVKAYTEKN